jgi:pilus assembly protein Flp/PilA
MRRARPLPKMAAMNDSNPIRVLLIEEHEHVLWGMEKLVNGEPAMQLAGTARNLAEAISALRVRRADVVLLGDCARDDQALDALFGVLRERDAALLVLTRALQAQPAEELLREIRHAELHRFAGSSAPHRTAGDGGKDQAAGLAISNSQENSMDRLYGGIRRFLKDENGANGVEYALLAGLIAVAFIVGAGLLGTNLNTFFNNLAACIAAPGTACNPFGGA